MEKIQVILKEDVPNLGRSGELVAVKPGYGRNYLIPQGLAMAATRKNVAEMEHHKKAIEAQAAKTRKDAESVANRLSGVTVRFERQVGEGDKLFGSVTAGDVADRLAAEGFKVDKKHIELDEPIKALGVYKVPVRLHADVKPEVRVWVVKE